MSKPQVYIVVSLDRPREPHVAGAFTSYENAVYARRELGKNDEASEFRSNWTYGIWQLPFDVYCNPQR